MRLQPLIWLTDAQSEIIEHFSVSLSEQCGDEMRVHVDDFSHPERVGARCINTEVMSALGRGLHG